MQILNLRRGDSFKGHSAYVIVSPDKKIITTTNNYFHRTIQEDYHIDIDMVKLITTKWLQPSKWLDDIIDRLKLKYQKYFSARLSYIDDNQKVDFYMTYGTSYIRFTMSTFHTQSSLSDHYNNIKRCKELDKKCKGIIEFTKNNVEELIHTSELKGNEIKLKGLTKGDIELFL